MLNYQLQNPDSSYCLLENTGEPHTNYEDIPSNLINSIVEENSTGKDFIAGLVIKQNPKVVGIIASRMRSLMLEQK